MSSTPPLAPSSEAQGYLLLTLDDVRVIQIFEGQRHQLASSELRLQCISIPIDPSIGHQRANPFADASDPSHDLWLVLEVGEYATTLLPTMKILVSRPANGGVAFFVPGEGALGEAGNGVEISVGPPKGTEDREDLETFEVLLRQYGCLPISSVPEVEGQAAVPTGPLSTMSITNPNPISSPLPSPPATASSGPPPLPARPPLPHSKSQGRLVLVDQTSGEIVGELSQQLSMEEDARLNEKGRENEVVVVDFGVLEDSGVAKSISVRTVDEEDRDDWMIKGASFLSKGILSVSSFATGQITSAAEFYIAHSTPTAEPVVFSPAAKEGIRQVHNVSAKGLRVTKKTLGMVNNAISKAIQPIAQFTAEAGYEAKEAAEPLANSVKQRINSFSNSPSGSRRSSFFADHDPSAIRRISASEGKPPAYDALGQNSAFPADVKQRRESLGSSTSAIHEEPNQYEQPEPKRSSKGFFQRLIIASEVVLTSLEATTSNLINTGTEAAASAAEHKFGPDAGHATKLLGGSVRHVALVYVDVRGVGRTALLKSTAKGFVKTTLKTGKPIKLQADAGKTGGQVTMGDGQVADGDLTVQVDEDVKGYSTALDSEKGLLTKRA